MFKTAAYDIIINVHCIKKLILTKKLSVSEISSTATFAMKSQHKILNRNCKNSSIIPCTQTYQTVGNSTHKSYGSRQNCIPYLEIVHYAHHTNKQIRIIKSISET
jgi:hypothetical protein